MLLMVWWTRVITACPCHHARDLKPGRNVFQTIRIEKIYIIKVIFCRGFILCPSSLSWLFNFIFKNFLKPCMSDRTANSAQQITALKNDRLARRGGDSFSASHFFSISPILRQETAWMVQRRQFEKRASLSALMMQCNLNFCFVLFVCTFRRRNVCLDYILVKHLPASANFLH